MDAVENIMELICDRCHYPWITTEEELEDYCAECEIERELRAVLEQNTQNAKDA